MVRNDGSSSFQIKFLSGKVQLHFEHNGLCISLCKLLFEPRREKTGLRGFRPGPTQTGLYSLRSRLEA